MCGITGILSENLAIQTIIESTTSALKHRGPDNSGTYIAPGVALGHRRLSIIDLSEQSNQPMRNQEGNLVIVYNGELYNYQSLREQLRGGYDFKTNSDTEVILAAFKAWGPDCLTKFNGIFAFAIWNTDTRQLFMARDPMGVKPLFYFRAENFFLFASEMQSLLASCLIDRQLSKQGLLDFLSYQSVHEPNSMIKGAYQLMAGHYAWVSGTSFEQSKYYDICQTTYEPAPYEDVRKNVAKLFISAVEKQLVSDVPLAIFLSGGIDSTAIVAAASSVSAKPIHSYSIAFKEAKYNESNYARLVAEKYKTKHSETVVSASVFIDQIEDALNAMSTPSGDGPNTYLISKLVRQAGIKVALSGLGGDEIFAGYKNFMNYYRLNRAQDKLPVWIRQNMGNLLTHSGIYKLTKAAEILGQPSLDIEYVYPAFRRIFREKEYEELCPILRTYNDTVNLGLKLDKEALNKLPVLSRYSIAELNNYTSNVLLKDADQMSMANGLEIRVPFLDIDLVSYVLGVPDKYKLPATPKKLLTDALHPYIPHEIIDRPKMGFSFPWAVWMKNELKSFCEIRIKSLVERELFNSNEVLRLWKAFLSGDNNVPWFKIWLLIVLEHWLERNNVTV